jgi:hypothetical protein
MQVRGQRVILYKEVGSIVVQTYLNEWKVSGIESFWHIVCLADKWQGIIKH